MNGPRDEMTEAELAAWQYAHRDELDTEEGDPVEVEFAPQLTVTMSFRLPGVEADLIRSAAAAADMSLSEWIRQACADAAAPDLVSRRRRDLETALLEAEQQLDAVKRRLQSARKKGSRTASRAARAKKA